MSSDHLAITREVNYSLVNGISELDLHKVTVILASEKVDAREETRQILKIAVTSVSCRLGRAESSAAIERVSRSQRER